VAESRFPLRFVTATALFDGHDAAINLVRRLLQAEGAEVVHLGHNRSVAEIVAAAVEEDAHGVAVSSYQGGHMEFLGYLLEELQRVGRGDCQVVAGGGGVIVAEEVAALEAAGVAKVFTPEDGRRLGLSGMAQAVLAACQRDLAADPAPYEGRSLAEVGKVGLARFVSALERGLVPEGTLAEVRAAARARRVPVLGVTGTGGAGKSSLTDELLRRFRLDYKEPLRIAVVAVDPSRRRGGALLGDRIRMNALDEWTFFRSLASRGAGSGLPPWTDDVVAACQAAGYDLVVLETPGIGQGQADLEGRVDVALYVMTPEYGAASQLEKIEMLEVADVVALNKADRFGAADALRDVARTLARQPRFAGVPREALPVVGTVASRFDDDGVTACYERLCALLESHGLPEGRGLLAARPATRPPSAPLVPPARSRYLAEVAETIRAYRRRAAEQVARVARAEALSDAAAALAGAPTQPADPTAPSGSDQAVLARLQGAAEAAWAEVDPALRAELAAWDERAGAFGRCLSPGQAEAAERHRVEGVDPGGPLGRRTLAGSFLPKVAVPRPASRAELARFLLTEQLPGRFPYTAGVFPLRRSDEEPTRMFAGEGTPARTNRRFHLLAEGMPSVRLSVAFDSVTLYGFDPDERPDIYGKIGNAGVSVATIWDMAELFEGFDLADPKTSVSMTINGPAPAILAMFLNVAIDQRVARAEAEAGRALSAEEREALAAEVLRTIRGTVQADILKEDQGQNTCIFSTDFALKMMADVQEWFVAHEVRHFYSVSISGYHIAEAGANPITQLAFTLANAFTYLEAFLARGMAVDDVAPNLSFFFSAGMDPEYAVLGRVARRIWAVALRDRYGANERSQRLKYHVQTSGRSLHAQEMAFNDIRTTLQALLALADNCNSLHTNAYDEAVTTPTEESVRRALAIQLVINRELGLMGIDNPLQGSYALEQLTDAVEEAVLEELDRLAERGGVLGAMELGYQRGRIQDESLRYEQAKHDGSLPVVGVNTFLRPGGEPLVPSVPLSRSTEEEKRRQVERVRQFQAAHAEETPAAIERLQRAALEGRNLFAELMSAVRVLSLGQITQALFEVGGRYRRNL
jgi:methylmalonyl-CoA mutase